MGFVDLHSHVLPGLDDGARALEGAMELCTILSAMGFERVCATPHQKVGQFVPSREAIDGAYLAVKEALAARSATLDLLLGAENFWDELLLSRWPDGRAPSYTGDRAFLFEIHPRMCPPRLDDTLFQMRMKGRLPVMAHPERYAPFWERGLERYQALGRTCALVVDLGALDGAHGQKECVAARNLVEQGVAHAAASDVHSPSDARSAGAGIAWIRKRLGESAVTRLLSDNPRRILNGELPD